MTESRSRVVLAIACALCAALPFFTVDIAPITDLPQHVAQMRLFAEATHDPHTPYTIQWLTPYWLGYLPLAAAWQLFTPLTAGRVAMAFLGVITVLLVHGLAARRGRSPDAAVLATVLFFSHNVYWGFYNFAWGWAVYLVWLHLVTRPPRRNEWLALAATATVLFFTHVLWLVFALGTLGLVTLRARPAPRVWLPRAAACVPAVALTGIWYVGFRNTWFATQSTAFKHLPWEQLYPWNLRDAILGGIHTSHIEDVVLAVLLGYVALGVGQAWQQRRLREAVDAPLLWLAGVMLVMYLALPYRTMNTIFFGERWMPCAATLLLLGVPAPRRRPALLRAGSLGLVGVFTLITVLTWRVFEADDLSGLYESLARLPDRPSVLGLDFVRHSDSVKGRPFLQTFAWAQVLFGGRLNFSFAEMPPSLVAFRGGLRPTWTVGLEWYPDRVQPTDFPQFDYALIGGRPQMHDRFGHLSGLEPLVDHGVWRLYRIRR
jgi:hypothetical protein